MYDTNFSNKAIDDLADKLLNVVNTTMVLTQQGYVVNKAKKNKVEWTSILIHALENLNILSEEQQASVERLYNNLFKV